MKLSKEILEELLYELEKTPLVNEKELEERISMMPQSWPGIKARTNFFTNTILTHYSFRNPTLNRIFTDLTKRNIKDAVSLHTVEVGAPDVGAVSHIDTHSHLTINILLEDDFEGGEFYLNHKKYDGLREKGDYALYNGTKEYHEVKPITKGRRKSLIVWYDEEKTDLF